MAISSGRAILSPDRSLAASFDRSRENWGPDSGPFSNCRSLRPRHVFLQQTLCSKADDRRSGVYCPVGLYTERSSFTPKFFGTNELRATPLSFSKPIRRGSGVKAQSADGGAEAQPAPPAKPFHWTDVTKNASSFMPQAILISTALGLFYPPSFTWFTNRYYPSALGFLMFAVGINLSLDDFKHAFQRPRILALGYFGQFFLKPLFGFTLAHTFVPALGLPDAIGYGLVLTACVSGAQLSNYASFLVDKRMAPLSIVMTALSTASAALITPALTQLLLGQRLPVDVKGMMVSILQCVVAPITAGLALNKFASSVSAAIRPVLPLLSLLDTCCCIGSPLAINARALQSPLGVAIVLPVLAFHTIAFVGGYYLATATLSKLEDRRSVARTMAFEIGMQSSLLALALANRFFPDPLVALPCAISVITMSLMGFGLVVVWTPRAQPAVSH